MSNRASLVSSAWKVLLDGVEVPHQGGAVTFIKDGLSFAEISLEPDAALVDIRPQTVVSIWAEERFTEDDVRYTSDKQHFANRYYLFWEGLVSGYTHDKAHDTRVFRIKCESKYAVWQKIKAFSLAVGGLKYSPLVSGSVNVNVNEQAKSDIFTLASLAANFARNTDKEVKPTFVDRLKATVGFLSSGNALLRLHTTRYGLLNGISGIDDDVYEQLLAPLSIGVFSSMPHMLGEDSSVFNILQHLQSYGFYHSVEIPIPVPITIDKPQIAETFLAKSDVYDFTLTYRRNHLLFVPTNYYALPPPCNLIFPDMIQSLTVDRSFYEEPTRTIAIDPLAAIDGRVVYVAPSSIIRNMHPQERASVTAAGVFAMSISALSNDLEGITSPYITRTGESTINLLSVVDNTELEKGIVVNTENFLFETLSAFARRKSSKEPDDTTAHRAYQAFVSYVLNYRHKLAQLTRNMAVQLNGHRYLVPGFTAAIFDSDISYLAFVDSVAFSFNPLGYETSRVQLSYARAIKPIDKKRVNEFVYKGSAITAALSSKLKEIDTFIFEDADQVKQAKLIARETSSAEIDTLARDYYDVFDNPIPPVFLNENFSRLDKLDKLYGSVLGCKPLYTGVYNRTSFDSLFGTILSSLTPQLQALLTYLEGILILNNVYQMFDKTALVSSSTSQPTWQDIYRSKNALGPSTLEWSHRTFIKRNRLYVKEYLQQNKLALFESISAEPSRKVFFQFIPVELLTNNGSLGDIDRWDNSIFSKLPMEPGKDDAVIAELRKTAPDYLKTWYRQKLFADYSTRHMGSRAFDGT